MDTGWNSGICASKHFNRPEPPERDERTRVKKEIKVSDILAGASGALSVLPVFIDQRNAVGIRLAVLIALCVGLGLSWQLTRGRHWIVKTIFFVGICLGCSLLAQMVAFALLP